MPALWNDVTVAQALLVGLAVWLLLRLGEPAHRAIRRYRGLPIYGDHCEHCGDVEDLADRIDRLVEYAHDQHAELEQIRAATERTADTTDQLADVR